MRTKSALLTLLCTGLSVSLLSYASGQEQSADAPDDIRQEQQEQASATEEVLVLENRPSDAPGKVIQAKVYGIRPMFELGKAAFLSKEGVNYKVRLSEEIFMTAASRTPEIKNALAHTTLDRNKPLVPQMKTLIETTDFAKCYTDVVGVIQPAYLEGAANKEMEFYDIAFGLETTALLTRPPLIRNPQGSMTTENYDHLFEEHSYDDYMFDKFVLGFVIEQLSELKLGETDDFKYDLTIKRPGRLDRLVSPMRRKRLIAALDEPIHRNCEISFSELKDLTFSIQDAVSFDGPKGLPTRLIQGANEIDAVSVVAFLGSGGVDLTQVQQKVTGGKKVYFYGVDDNISESLININAGVERLNYAPMHDVPKQIEEILKLAKKFDQIEKSLLYELGAITFGLQTVYTAEERKLKLPKFLADRYDVYWIDLNVTFRDLSRHDLSEMGFHVTMPSDAVALKLIPLRYYGIEVEEGVTTGGEGGATAKVASVGFDFGAAYERDIKIKYLKPTINSFGQGEHQFSWVMTEEAMAAGSHEFYVIVGVPKGTEQLALGLSAHVNLDLNLWQKDRRAGTEVSLHELPLQ